MKKSFLLAALCAFCLASCASPIAPETTPLDTPAVETAAPETNAPETAALETSALETSAPETEPPAPPVSSLTINGTDIAEFVISCNPEAGGVISHAAEELQSYIAAATGVTLPITTDPADAPRIAIDETIVSDPNNFRYYSDENGIVLAGSAKRSALYAVYHFLENQLGWRFFAADTETCAEADAIDLASIDVTFEHAFEIRDIYWTEAFDEDWSVKRYQNGDGKRRKMYNDNPESVIYGGSEHFHHYGIHTFARLAEQESSNQPCLNDEAVYQTMLKNALAWFAEDPTRTMIHVSQNDNTRYCTCDACTADAENYGSPAASIIKLVNRMDADLKANGYEDKTIVTFAYRYSFPCPKGITCNEDIAVELCTINYCYNHAFDDPSCEINAANMKEIRAWSEICSQFYIWDYTINFKYYLSPFPNFDVLLDNIRVLSGIGAIGIIEQGNYQTKSGEFGALRSYLLAKALENPNMSSEEYYGHMDAFLEAYYGPGWEYVRKFIDFVTDLSNEKNFCFGIYTSPEDMYGDHAFAPHSDELVEWWDKAEEMAETPLQLEHVRRSRLCCDYLRLGAIHKAIVNEMGVAGIQYRRDLIKAFLDACTELEIGRIAENCPLPESVNYDLNVRAWWKLHEYKD